MFVVLFASYGHAKIYAAFICIFFDLVNGLPIVLCAFDKQCWKKAGIILGNDENISNKNANKYLCSRHTLLDQDPTFEEHYGSLTK